jgi:hypothetical protein
MEIPESFLTLRIVKDPTASGYWSQLRDLVKDSAPEVAHKCMGETKH